MQHVNSNTHTPRLLQPIVNHGATLLKSLIMICETNVIYVLDLRHVQIVFRSDNRF